MLKPTFNQFEKKWRIRITNGKEERWRIFLTFLQCAFSNVSSKKRRREEEVGESVSVGFAGGAVGQRLLAE